MHLELVQPSLSRAVDFVGMVAEFLAAGEHEYIDEDVLFSEEVAPYVDWLDKGRRAEIAGLVPGSAFWAVDADSGALLGLSSLRHELCAWRAELGGHIGYHVCPSQRGCGMDTALLRLTLQQASTGGLSKALIVCTPENMGSQTVLRNNGVVFERDVYTGTQRPWRYCLTSPVAIDAKLSAQAFGQAPHDGLGDFR